MPLVVPLGEEGNQAMIAAHGESHQITSIGALRDRQEFSVPSHVFRLVLEPPPARDSVETQGIFLDKFPIFQDRFCRYR